MPPANETQPREPEPKSAATPERVANYKIVRRIATGGTSDVLLARGAGGPTGERDVVLKILLPHHRQDPAFERLFGREAAAYARLSHPAIVRLFDFLTEDGQLVLVLEYVDGLPLHKVRTTLKQRGEDLDDRASLYLASRVFSALGAAHAVKDPETGDAAPVVHRDVNPSNVLIPWDGHAKLADFGIAKVTGMPSDTRTGLTKGTFGYMAPEQAKAQPISARADVYSAALVLWELLTRRRAIQRQGLTEADILQAMAKPQLPSLDVLRPTLPKALRDALRAGLEPSAERRNITADEFYNVLRAATNLDEGRTVLAAAMAKVKPAPIGDLVAQSAARAPQPSWASRPVEVELTPSGQLREAPRPSHPSRPDEVKGLAALLEPEEPSGHVPRRAPTQPGVGLPGMPIGGSSPSIEERKTDPTPAAAPTDPSVAPPEAAGSGPLERAVGAAAVDRSGPASSGSPRGPGSQNAPTPPPTRAPYRPWLSSSSQPQPPSAPAPAEPEPPYSSFLGAGSSRPPPSSHPPGNYSSLLGPAVPGGSMPSHAPAMVGPREPRLTPAPEPAPQSYGPPPAMGDPTGVGPPPALYAAVPGTDPKGLADPPSFAPISPAPPAPAVNPLARTVAAQPGFQGGVTQQGIGPRPPPPNAANAGAPVAARPAPPSGRAPSPEVRAKAFSEGAELRASKVPLVAGVAGIAAIGLVGVVFLWRANAAPATAPAPSAEPRGPAVATVAASTAAPAAPPAAPSPGGAKAAVRPRPEPATARHEPKPPEPPPRAEPPKPEPPKMPAKTAASKPGTGTVTPHASAKGHRIYVDGRVAGHGAAPITLPCGKHTVKMGSAGRPQVVDVPCGGDVDLKP